MVEGGGHQTIMLDYNNISYGRDEWNRINRKDSKDRKFSNWQGKDIT